MVEAPLSARAALLQALVVPGYGLELIERIRRATRGLMRVGMGSLYPTLRALEGEGLVRSRLLRARPGAGRPRRYFELTLAGVGARNAERRAVAALFRVGEDRLRRESARLIEERLRRCLSASASVSNLRRRVREEQGGGA